MDDKAIIRQYQETDGLEWLDLHASLMVDSYAWWTVIHKKPVYENETIDLVAVKDGQLVGLILIEINAAIMNLPDEDFGFVWEFGVHRDHRGLGLGRKLIERAHQVMQERFGINKSYWYSQDEKAQAYYERLGMKEIERHWQFSIYPTRKQKELFQKDGFDCWQMRGSSSLADFDRVKEEYNLIEDDDALKPRICVGYEYKHELNSQ